MKDINKSKDTSRDTPKDISKALCFMLQNKKKLQNKK